MLKGSRTSLNEVEPDRPRKKLSFREPEVMGVADKKSRSQDGLDRREPEEEGPRRKISVVERGELVAEGRNVGDEEGRRVDARRLERSLTAESYVSWLHRRISEEDEEELESQAMKIVRTVGQAFEVCHKLSVSSANPLDDDVDPLRDAEASSEKDSDAFSEPRKGDGMSDVPDDSDLNLNLDSPTVARPRHLHLDMIPPPPVSHKPSSAPAGLGETISSPLLEPLKDTSDLPSAGSALSAHHEIQLLREQLEQQVQQTQAAVAQVHLLRDQLTAETTARIEAQARTHQLLVHNKELLDHITALVSHLQDNERPKHDSNVTNIPQAYVEPSAAFPDGLDTDVYLGLENNRQSGAFVTAPSSPKARHSTFFPQPSIHTTPSLYTLFPTAEQQFQAQLLQRLQGLSGYPPLLSPTVYPPPVTYSWNSFPTPYMPKRKDDDVRRCDVRLEPPPGRRKEREVRIERLDVGPEVLGTDRGGRRDDSKDRRRDNSRERADGVRRDESRDRRLDPRNDDDRWGRQESREQKERREDVRDKRDYAREQSNRDDDARERRGNSREKSSRDVREGSRDRRDGREGSRDRSSRDVREGSRGIREGSRDRRDPSRDKRESSRDALDDRPSTSRNKREESRDRRGEPSREEPSRDRGGVSPKTSSPTINLPPRSPASPVHSPKSSYTNAFASALSSIKTLRVGDKSKKTPGTSTPGPITRSTSEKVQNRSELMDLVQRTAWARQTK